jgi:hypothetical protein
MPPFVGQQILVSQVLPAKSATLRSPRVPFAATRSCWLEPPAAMRAVMTTTGLALSGSERKKRSSARRKRWTVAWNRVRMTNSPASGQGRRGFLASIAIQPRTISLGRPGTPHSRGPPVPNDGSGTLTKPAAPTVRSRLAPRTRAPNCCLLERPDPPRTALTKCAIMTALPRQRCPR